MKRRDLLAIMAALGCANFPLRAFGQAKPAGRPYRIAFAYRNVSDEARELQFATLEKHGWRRERDFVFLESDEVVIDFTKADESVARMLAQKPDVLITVSTAHAVAAYRQTKSVPIVMIISGYPVEAGLADSLARPGRNVTGNALYASTGIWGKLLELLKDARLGIKRIGVLWTYVSPAFVREEIEQCYVELRRGAGVLGVSVDIVNAARDDEIPAAIDRLVRGKPDALITTSGAGTWKNWERVMAFALERRLPTIYDSFRIPGMLKGPMEPLLHYAPDRTELRERCYAYVDKILRGAKPQDLPILLPSRFNLTVNLATARAIGLQVPQTLLLRANHVID